MKKKLLILLFSIIVITILLFLLFFNKHKDIKIKKFIDNYNTLIQENLDRNFNIQTSNFSKIDGATYWVKMTDDIELGIMSDGGSVDIDINNDHVSVVMIRYSKDTIDYKQINNYLFYLIKASNNKIDDSTIRKMIQELRNNEEKKIIDNNLIISHSKDAYQIDSIGKYS